MLRIILSSCLLCIVFSFGAGGVVLDEKGQPHPEVIRIFEIFQFNLGPSPSLETLNRIGQKEFLRPAKTERLSKESIEHYKKLCSQLSPQDQDEILDHFRRIGDIEAVYPFRKDPNYILIQGSTLSSLRERIMFFVFLVEKEKIKLLPNTNIIFLMGDRDLFASETKEVLLNPAPFKLRKEWRIPKVLPTNELDLGEFVWKQLDLPPALQKQTPIFVKAPKKPNAPRAQTEDCVTEFLKKHDVPEQSTFLVISGNPYVYYQKRVTELMFKKRGYGNKRFSVEAVGDATPIHENDDKFITIGILLDNLARTLYTEIQFLK
ncbi:MAG: hypothetical protein K2W92_09490 [Alphaproteobacteria bacterium]|nr:hypothetical protein [Alphaproteobacteria bacterium]